MISKKLPLFAILTASALCAPAFAMNWIYPENITCWDQLKEIQDEVHQDIAYQKQQQEKFILLCSSATFDHKASIKKMFESLTSHQQKQVKNLYKLTLWTLYIKKINHEQTVAYSKKLQETFLELKHPHYKDRKKLKRALKILRSMDESHPSYADMAKLVQLLALKCQSSNPFKQTPKLAQLDYTVMSQDVQERNWLEALNELDTTLSMTSEFIKKNNTTLSYAAKVAWNLGKKIRKL